MQLQNLKLKAGANLSPGGNPTSPTPPLKNNLQKHAQNKQSDGSQPINDIGYPTNITPSTAPLNDVQTKYIYLPANPMTTVSNYNMHALTNATETMAQLKNNAQSTRTSANGTEAHETVQSQLYTCPPHGMIQLPVPDRISQTSSMNRKRNKDYGVQKSIAELNEYDDIDITSMHLQHAETTGPNKTTPSINTGKPNDYTERTKNSTSLMVTNACETLDEPLDTDKDNADRCASQLGNLQWSIPDIIPQISPGTNQFNTYNIPTMQSNRLKYLPHASNQLYSERKDQDIGSIQNTSEMEFRTQLDYNSKLRTNSCHVQKQPDSTYDKDQSTKILYCQPIMPQYVTPHGATAQKRNMTTNSEEEYNFNIQQQKDTIEKADMEKQKKELKSKEKRLKLLEASISKKEAEIDIIKSRYETSRTYISGLENKIEELTGMNKVLERKLTLLEAPSKAPMHSSDKMEHTQRGYGTAADSDTNQHQNSSIQLIIRMLEANMSLQTSRDQLNNILLSSISSQLVAVNERLTKYTESAVPYNSYIHNDYTDHPHKQQQQFTKLNDYRYGGHHSKYQDNPSVGNNANGNEIHVPKRDVIPEYTSNNSGINSKRHKKDECNQWNETILRKERSASNHIKVHNRYDEEYLGKQTAGESVAVPENRTMNNSSNSGHMRHIPHGSGYHGNYDINGLPTRHKEAGKAPRTAHVDPKHINDQWVQEKGEYYRYENRMNVTSLEDNNPYGLDTNQIGFDEGGTLSSHSERSITGEKYNLSNTKTNCPQESTNTYDATQHSQNLEEEISYYRAIDDLKRTPNGGNYISTSTIDNVKSADYIADADIQNAHIQDKFAATDFSYFPVAVNEPTTSNEGIVTFESPSRKCTRYEYDPYGPVGIPVMSGGHLEVTPVPSHHQYNSARHHRKFDGNINYAEPKNQMPHENTSPRSYNSDGDSNWRKRCQDNAAKASPKARGILTFSNSKLRNQNKHR